MAEKTEISWADHTYNAWVGCTKVSPGCDSCYAKTLMDDRYHRVKWGAGEARSRTKTAGEPVKWNRAALADGKPHRVFCASLSDVFDNEVPIEWRRELFDLIYSTPALTWMLLTKRIGNLRSMRWPPPASWLGITVVNQEEADRDIPKLLASPKVAVRWLSCEPLLGPLDLRPYLEGHEEHGLDERMKPGACIGYTPPIDWVIVGGESGKDARPMAPEWVRDIRAQCETAGVPFHFKQWGGVRPKANGHLLDGREYRAFPDLPCEGRSE